MKNFVSIDQVKQFVEEKDNSHNKSICAVEMSKSGEIVRTAVFNIITIPGQNWAVLTEIFANGTRRDAKTLDSSKFAKVNRKISDALQQEFVDVFQTEYPCFCGIASVDISLSRKLNSKFLGHNVWIIPIESVGSVYWYLLSNEFQSLFYNVTDNYFTSGEIVKVFSGIKVIVQDDDLFHRQMTKLFTREKLLEV